MLSTDINITETTYSHTYSHFILSGTALEYLQMLNNELHLIKNFDADMAKNFKVRILVLRKRQIIF